VKNSGQLRILRLLGRIKDAGIGSAVTHTYCQCSSPGI